MAWGLEMYRVWVRDCVDFGLDDVVGWRLCGVWVGGCGGLENVWGVGWRIYKVWDGEYMKCWFDHAWTVGYRMC